MGDKYSGFIPEVVKKSLTVLLPHPQLTALSDQLLQPFHDQCAECLGVYSEIYEDFKEFKTGSVKLTRVFRSCFDRWGCRFLCV